MDILDSLPSFLKKGLKHTRRSDRDAHRSHPYKRTSNARNSRETQRQQPIARTRVKAREVQREGGIQRDAREPNMEKESDPRRIEQRLKQIEYGKNTPGYENYLLKVPKDKRRYGDPQTPDATTKISKRSFDGLIRQWRRLLHDYDTSEAALSSSRADDKKGDSNAPKSTEYCGASRGADDDDDLSDVISLFDEAEDDRNELGDDDELFEILQKEEL